MSSILLGSKKPSKVTGVRPVASQVLLELLTQQEMMNTKFFVGNKRPSDGAYQAYVLAVGPSLKQEDWGFKVGDRVIISGGGVPVPVYGETERERVLMEPTSIKAVLSEE